MATKSWKKILWFDKQCLKSYHSKLYEFSDGSYNFLEITHSTLGAKLSSRNVVLLNLLVSMVLGHLILNRLFIKVPQPGDSEGTFSVFESSCHLLLPV